METVRAQTLTGVRSSSGVVVGNTKAGVRSSSGAVVGRKNGGFDILAAYEVPCQCAR